MSDKKGTFIVTGANGGLGKAVAVQFLSNADISASNKALWGVRNPSRADALQEELSRFPDASDHEIVKIDISTLESVRSAASQINSRVASGELAPIRTLVLNAAVQYVTGQMYTDEKLESTFAVNYLANFLLITLLIESMDKKAGRIVIVASWTHDPAHLLNGFIVSEEHKTIYRGDLQTLAQPGKDKEGDDYNAGMRRYGASKTLIIMMMYEMQKRLNADSEYSNVSILAVDPGAMPATGLIRDSSGLLQFFVHRFMGSITPLLTYLFPNGYFRTATKSASDILKASFNEREYGKYPKAMYLNGSAKTQSSAETRDEEKQKQLWSQSVEMAGLKQSESVLNLN